VSIVSDRRCDGCQEIRAGNDETWWALIPPGTFGADDRQDFCDLKCLQRWLKAEKALSS
jgi:hypothetical protein